jgi:hypothetical protein
MEGETLAEYTRSERREKAQKQLRDRNGRWIAEGANVRWRSAGQDWAGTVLGFEDGRAVVQVKHKDGSKTITRLEADTLRVMASKATLSSRAAKKPSPI